jgi:aspartate aminotransferase
MTKKSPISNRLNKLEESATIAMAQKSRELKNKGLDIISLSLGEPDFDTPDFIKASAKKAIDDNYTKYMAVNGYEDLRQAICEKLKRDNDLDYTPEQIVVSTGAKQCIANAVLSLINEGDEVLIPIPYWVTYVEIIKMADGIPVFVNSTVDTDFKVTAQQLEEKITDKTKLMIFSTPCNPSGSVYSKEELQSIAQLMEKYPNLHVISDEIYELIIFGQKHESLAQFDSVKDRVITINGLSKGFSMTGWRLGYLAASKEIAQACTKLQGQFTSGTNSITQRAAITALQANPEVTFSMRDAFLKRRDLVLAAMKDIPGIKCNIPQGAFYVYPDISAFFGKKTPQGKTIETANDLSLFLLEEALVATVTGEAFGSPECIRISYATDEKTLENAMKRIKEALSKLN